MVDERKQDIVVTKPADISLKGQKMHLALVRPAEVWQFCAFVFAALLTLTYYLIDDFGWRSSTWYWAIVLRGVPFAALAYFLIFNRWGRAHLVRFLNWIKLEPA